MPLTEISGKPKPRMPSKWAAMKATPGSFLASAKRRLGTETEPTVTVSCDVTPESEPEPYWMANAVLFAVYVDDLDESYFECSLHAMLSSEHDLDGTHRLDEPVSNTTLKFCGGVPIEMGP